MAKKEVKTNVFRVRASLLSEGQSLQTKNFGVRASFTPERCICFISRDSGYLGIRDIAVKHI